MIVQLLAGPYDRWTVAYGGVHVVAGISGLEGKRIPNSIAKAPFLPS